MKQLLALALFSYFPLSAQEPTIAIVGLVHSHVWGPIVRMAKGQTPARLVAVAEPNLELVAEAKKVTGDAVPYFDDYKKMLDQVKPQIVWAFVENNRHLEIVQACAPRKIQIMFEKPLAATYKDAQAIAALAKKHGVRVMTNYQMAWWPANYAAKAQADAGTVGKVWRLRGIVGHGGPGSQGARNKFFFEWLTDPVKNGAGALMDFGCYNALWSLWYFGKPESVYAQALHLRPETFPKVEDSATLVLKYKNAVGVFEGSWDLPRGFQDLEVFGLNGSLYMTQRGVELRQRRETKNLDMEPLPKERAEPIAYMVDAMRENKPIEGMTALDINVDVVEIIEAAKRSVATGRAVLLPLR